MEYALELKQVHKIYRNEKVALNGIDLAVRSGDFFALLGPNGAGKSTTIGIISGLVNKTSGQVKVFNVDIDQNVSLAKSYIGIVPQEINFSQFETCHEIVVNQAGYYGMPRSAAKKQAEFYLKQLGLWDRRFERSRNLSGGLKRRLMIARALVHNPKLLILDEPTAGVDVELRRSMWDFLQEINQQGTTIVLTTHYLEEAERLCKNIAIIDHGQIIEHSSMRDLLEKVSFETMELTLDCNPAVDQKIHGFTLQKIEDLLFEVNVTQDQDINDLFKQLINHNIGIRSIRSTSNRLEELFINLVEKQ